MFLNSVNGKPTHLRSRQKIQLLPTHRHQLLQLQISSISTLYPFHFFPIFSLCLVQTLMMFFLISVTSRLASLLTTCTLGPAIFREFTLPPCLTAFAKILRKAFHILRRQAPVCSLTPAPCQKPPGPRLSGTWPLFCLLFHFVNWSTNFHSQVFSSAKQLSSAWIV